MQLYKFLLLFILAILAAIVLKLPQNLDGLLLSWSHSALNHDLSIRTIIISFLLVAFLAVLPAKSLNLSEMFFFSTYTISSLIAVLFKQVLLVIVFFELMSVSAFFIISASCKDSGHAIRYACLHFFVGVILIAGLAFQSTNLIIFGLLINCACFPFSFWVINAYPCVSLHSTTYLSLFTTKISFLVMLLHTYKVWENYAEILSTVGTITVLYSIIFASLERNIRRFLCYNLIGQAGLLIIVGSLISRSEMAIPILMLQVIFSLLYQSLLFIVSNSIITRIKTASINRTGKAMLVESICATIAVLTMIAFPGTAGFISKSYISMEIEVNSSALEWHKDLYKILNLLLHLSVGLKFFYYVFTSRSKLKLLEEKNEGKVSMLALSAICIITGNPYLPIYNRNEVLNSVYNVKNISLQFCLLLLATLLLAPLQRKLFYSRVNFKMDIDWVSRIFISCIVLINQSTSKVKKIFSRLVQSLTSTSLCFYTDRLKEILNYNSVSFVSSSSLFLMNILLLILLCLNR